MCVVFDSLFLKHLFGNHIITYVHLKQKIGGHYLLRTIEVYCIVDNSAHAT